MLETTKTPKVFISYSWTTPLHEDWVINLAERLMSDGVEVIIDKWNLKEGHDKYTFMESMVTSKDVDKVLIILDKKYSEKADDRSGGVGTETQIISPQIYSNVSQEKFIPIVTERDENGKEYLPAYLESRIYIDLSSSEHFESNYEKLLRNIFQRPAYSKPKIGRAPSYLFEETPSLFKTNTLVRSFENQIDKYPKRINSIIREFLEDYFNSLKDFSITFTNRNDLEVGKEVIDNLNQYSQLRNDYIAFLDKISKTELQFDVEILIKLFEKLPVYKRPLNDRSSWSNYEFDNFRFIIHELFLYTIAIPLKNENYKLVEELLYSGYIIKDKYEIKKEPSRFDVFYNHVEIFDAYYKQIYSKNFYSPMADFIIKRIPEDFNQDQLIEADLLCHYIGRLNNLRWFPITYVYNTRGNFELFDRLISLRHFEKVKVLFNVQTVEELKEVLKKYKETDKDSHGWRYSNAFDSVIPIYSLIDIEEIGTTR
ncbi:MAG: SEFIR domain-containing protein [Chitinophagaceae bacterium]